MPARNITPTTAPTYESGGNWTSGLGADFSAGGDVLCRAISARTVEATSRTGKLPAIPTECFIETAASREAKAMFVSSKRHESTRVLEGFRTFMAWRRYCFYLAATKLAR